MSVDFPWCIHNGMLAISSKNLYDAVCKRCFFFIFESSIQVSQKLLHTSFYVSYEKCRNKIKKFIRKKKRWDFACILFHTFA